MTAINMMVQPKARAGFLISDGAHTLPDGTVCELAPKIIHGAGRFPWAMGITGNVHPATLLHALGEANPINLKQLVKRLSEAIREAMRRTAVKHAMPLDDVLCGVRGVAWDFARKRPIGFVLVSDPAALLPGAIAFAWHETAWNITATPGAASPGDILGREVDITDPASFDPERDGLALIVAQRERGVIDTMVGLEPGHCRIGGEVDLTEVTKHGVRVWRIHDFGDVVGERIGKVQD
jgi:hypothetical protein